MLLAFFTSSWVADDVGSLCSAAFASSLASLAA